MMELDMWNETFLAGDWSTSLPVEHSGGLFGDIKSEGCLDGNYHPGFQLQDAVEHVRSDSPSRNEDFLGLEWMESPDLGSFLGANGNSYDKLLPLEASLIEFTYSIAPEEPTTPEDNKCDSLPGVLAGHTLDSLRSTDILSPPSSPEQVAPVIKVEPERVAACNRGGSVKLAKKIHDSFLDDEFEASFEDQIFTGLDFTSVVTFDDASELITSPLTVDEVDSMLSDSLPTSPCLSESRIIESSPELYKVISTSSISDSKFSPYPKSKTSKHGKLSCRTRPPAEPVPESIILEQLNKKDRKKLQNKNAAIRYRMKKKEEAVGIKSEEQILAERNVELRTQVDDLQREIKYMKNLMEDICRARGLI